MVELDSEGCAVSGQAKTWVKRLPGRGAVLERMQKEEGARSVPWDCKGFHFSLLQSITKE